MDDKMTILGKDGNPRYSVTDTVKPLFNCKCDEPQPRISVDTISTLTGTGAIYFQECAACGGRIKERK